MATVDRHVTVETATRDEILSELDGSARELLGISGDEFLARWRSGELDRSDPAVGQVGVLARLIRL